MQQLDDPAARTRRLIHRSRIQRWRDAAAELIADKRNVTRGSSPYRRVYKRAPLPKHCRRSAILTSAILRQSNHRAGLVEIEPVKRNEYRHSQALT